MSSRTVLALSALVVTSAAFATEPPDEIPIPSLPELLRRQWSLRDEAAPPVPQPTRDDTVERLSLREAIALALENNPSIAVERLGPLVARADVRRTRAVFDPELTLFGRTSRVIEPTSSALAGAEELREETREYGATIEKFVRTGAEIRIEALSTELDSNSDFIGLRPQYRPDLLLTVTQPLLRNFGPNLTVLLVRSAEALTNVAWYEYAARTSDFVGDVIEAYWEVVRARETLASEQEGLRLARELERENGLRVKAGVLPPIAMREAGAEAARRDERVIIAEADLTIALERLRLLLQRNPDDAFVPRAVEPTDSPDVRPITTDADQILATALERRPEIRQARFDIESQQIVARVRRNDLLPSLDLEASYGVVGLSGRARPVEDFRTGEIRRNPFGGDYGDALDRLASDRFNRYTAGLTLSFPLGNDAAEADYAEAKIEAQRAELVYRKVLSEVTLDVRQAISRVRANSKRITATRLARELSEENLEQQKKRLEVGRTTTTDLLDFQEDLTAARAAEIAALVEYNLSLADLRRAEGTLLEEFDVVLEELPPVPTPLWARF